MKTDVEPEKSPEEWLQWLGQEARGFHDPVCPDGAGDACLWALAEIARLRWELQARQQGGMRVTAEEIAQAISLKVLADAPDSRGPFVLETSGRLEPDEARALSKRWAAAFERAGRPCPVLIILAAGARLRSATEEEAAGG